MHDTLRRIDRLIGAYLQTPSGVITDQNEALALKWAKTLRNTPTTKIAVDLIPLQKETNAMYILRPPMTPEIKEKVDKTVGMRLVLDARLAIRDNDGLINMLPPFVTDAKQRSAKRWTLEALQARIASLLAENTYLEQFDYQPAQKSV
jgi:hypothetical protein